MTSSDFIKYAWDLCIVNEDGVNTNNGSGVTIDDKFILTCSHILPKNSTSRITGRRVENHRVQYELQLAKDCPEWDLALLKLVESPNAEFESPLISHNEVLGICERLYHMGFSGDFGVGSVSYPCTKVDPFAFKGQCDWAGYKPDKSVCREYCILGDSKSSPFIADISRGVNLNPNVPVILCSGMGGTSGGAVFRGSRELVGIVLHGGGGISTCLHVSVIKEFLKDFYAEATTSRNSG